ncbi:hypothetical protein PG988_006067 [Apiospora saccharicola]
MDLEAIRAHEPPEEGCELRRIQPQSDPVLPPPLDPVPAPPSVQSPCSSTFTQSQTQGVRQRIRFSFGPLLNVHMYGFLERLRACWKFVRTEGKSRNCRETFLSVVTFLALLVAGVALWPSIDADIDGRGSKDLAEWEARDRHLSYCERHDWPSPSCDELRGKQLEPPPLSGGSGWKRLPAQHWWTVRSQLHETEMAQANNVSSDMTLVLIGFPVCASLLICISIFRDRRFLSRRYRIWTLLRRLSNLPRRLLTVLMSQEQHENSYRNTYIPTDHILVEPTHRSNAVTSGAHLKQNQGPQRELRRRNLPRSNDETRSDLAGWKTPTLTGTGYVEIHDNQENVSVPSIDTSPTIFELFRPTSTGQYDHPYRCALPKVLDRLQANTVQYEVGNTCLSGDSPTTPSFDKEAQASIADVEMYYRPHCSVAAKLPVKDYFKSVTDLSERPLAIYIFRDAGNQLRRPRLRPSPFNIKVGSDLGLPTRDPGLQSFISPSSSELA